MDRCVCQHITHSNSGLEVSSWYDRDGSSLLAKLPL